MDVNFSPSSFSPPRPGPGPGPGVGVKVEPPGPSLSLALSPPDPSPSPVKRSRPPTASPGTPYTGAGAKRPLALPSLPAGAGAGERHTSAAPSLARAEDPEEPEEEEEQATRLEDEVYKAQQAQQGRAKVNLKVLMDSFSEEQQTRYDWYRRSTLNKSNVRKLIQSTGTLVTPQVAQMVAGVGKVFVGEITERALQVQEMRGEHGPLTPEHLRLAYQMYKDDKGNVGAARPLRGKRLAL